MEIGFVDEYCMHQQMIFQSFIVGLKINIIAFAFDGSVCLLLQMKNVLSRAKTNGNKCKRFVLVDGFFGDNFWVH
jgi:hypothetical protein